MKRIFSSTTSTSIGEQAENQAKNYLIKQGLTFIERNYRCRQGEIDLIMQEREQIVFVEVKFRSRNDYGSGLEAVNLRKQQHIINAARHYLHTHKLTESISSRFDIVCIDASNKQADTCWLRNAFTC